MSDFKVSPIKAIDCHCCKCGEQAVAFWPIVDPDVPSYPWCRACLDKAQFKLIAKITELMEDRPKSKNGR